MKFNGPYYTDKTFELSDGERLAYRLEGNTLGPTILFWYGLASSPYHFKHQWDYLKKYARVLIVDYRGHFNSSYPKGLAQLNFQQMAKDVFELIQELSLDESLIQISHSMGVRVALTFNALYPEKVQSSIYVGGADEHPAVGKKELNRQLQALTTWIKILHSHVPGVINQLWQGQKVNLISEKVAGIIGFNAKLCSKTDMHEVLNRVADITPDVFIHLMDQFLETPKLDLFNQTQHPNLVIAGGRDRMIPLKYQREFAEKLQGFELEVLEDCSHCPQLDRPALVNQLIRKFIQKQGAFKNLQISDV